MISRAQPDRNIPLTSDFRLQTSDVDSQPCPASSELFEEIILLSVRPQRLNVVLSPQHFLKALSTSALAEQTKPISETTLL